MSCRSISWFICIFVVVVIAPDYSGTDSIKGSDPGVTINRSITDSPDSFTVEPIQGTRQTTALDVDTPLLSEPPAETSTPATGDSRPTPSAESHSDHGDHGRTPASAVTPAASCSSRPVNATAVSLLRNLPAEEKGTRLIYAAEEGAVEDLQALLVAGANVGARDEIGQTALHWAAQWGHTDSVKCLLEAGAEVDARSDGQSTPLHLAAERGHSAVVRLLLASSADPNARTPYGRTPLHSAAEQGHTAVVRLLLAFSANHSATDHDGWTPLHLAAFSGVAETAAALLEAGADKGVTSNLGNTPLDIARERDKQQLVDMLK
ncbi:26S proteasome non-ATPase regulatory subunit 10-like [Schistocerca nitens]|uniref:26S proteasome non-ATPase regulatory subunit 10-like n=1 Tax=Schistocerca nitens TaxID=7011 RepID=UPI002117FE38|nr:26S proteasome non-ATPase regulatory subunit 10-like [Schistocerca nitens]XP_049815988.1 26S proteasome non-ATPase regulatory subunit 10-like [Schistocerca nitens]